MATKKATEQKIQNTNTMKTPTFYVRLLLVGIVVVVGAIFIGRSGSGAIDVTTTIQNSNQANTAAQGNSNNNVATVPEAFRNKTNGGLVPQEGEANNNTQQETPTPNTETGTTTDTTTGTTTETAPEAPTN
jgi:hypothetical protein